MLGIRRLGSPAADAGSSLERAPLNFDEEEHKMKGRFGTFAK